MFKSIITNFSFKSFTNGTLLDLKLDIKDFILMGVVVIVLYIIGILKEKGINIRESVASKKLIVRWAIYYSLILSIIIFGSYGLGIVPLDPMYANF